MSAALLVFDMASLEPPAKEARDGRSRAAAAAAAGRDEDYDLSLSEGASPFMEAH